MTDFSDYGVNSSRASIVTRLKRIQTQILQSSSGPSTGKARAAGGHQSRDLRNRFISRMPHVRCRRTLISLVGHQQSSTLSLPG